MPCESSSPPSSAHRCHPYSDAMVAELAPDGTLRYTRADDPQREAYSYQKPFILELEITQRCNLNCLHCYAEADDRPFEDELSFPEIEGVLDDAQALGIRELSLTGGEVLTRPDFFDIVDAGLARSMAIRLVTNATLVSRAIVAKLSERPIKMITVSLDGITPSVHNHIRGAQVHGQALAGIKALRDAGLRLSIITAFSLPNLNEFDALHRFCLEQGLDWQVQMTSAKGRCKQDLTLSPDGYYRLGEMVASAQFQSAAGPITIIPMDDLATPSHFAPLNVLFSTWQGKCTGGLLNLFVRSTGEVTPCSALAWPECVVGNVRTDGLRRICIEERCRTYLDQFGPASLTGFCASCAVKERCGGGCPDILLSMCRQPTENEYCYRRMEEGVILKDWFDNDKNE